MKFVALLGTAAATQQVIGHEFRLAILNNIIEMSPTDESLLQVGGGPWDPTEEFVYGEVPAAADTSNEAEPSGYVRDIPGRFTAERDDRLMNSLIGKYAREVTFNGQKTGQMFCNKEDAKGAFDEVTRTHPMYQKNAGDFEGAWAHFDVNGDGLVEVERMPQFLRYAFPNGALDIDLQ